MINWVFVPAPFYGHLEGRAEHSKVLINVWCFQRPDGILRPSRSPPRSPHWNMQESPFIFLTCKTAGGVEWGTRDKDHTLSYVTRVNFLGILCKWSITLSPSNGQLSVKECGMHSCVYMCIWRPRADIMFLPWLPLGHGLLLNPELINSGQFRVWISSWFVWRNLCLFFLLDYRRLSHPSAFNLGSGVQVPDFSF